MKHLRRLCLALGIITLFVIVIVSCKKDKSDSPVPQGQQRISIRLSDNPVPYQAVNVDIQKVIVQVIPDSCIGNGDRDRDRNHHHEECYEDNEFRCSVWDTLNIRPGIYNLLNLSNGTDTLLASGLTLQGRINKIKLILGNNNSVVVDSVSYPLTLWNNNHAVTIQVRGHDIIEITPTDLQLWLDFDAGSSIVRVSNNHFVLKPRLRIWVPSQTSSISGKVLPKQAGAIVAAYTSTDTLVAIPSDHDGRFKIRGLTGTSAKVFINATANNYKDTTINSVPLQRGQDTNIGTITLHQ
jgi:Domain of unknown function (DUF4382)